MRLGYIKGGKIVENNTQKALLIIYIAVICVAVFMIIGAIYINYVAAQINKLSQAQYKEFQVQYEELQTQYKEFQAQYEISQEQYEELQLENSKQQELSEKEFEIYRNLRDDFSKSLTDNLKISYTGTAVVGDADSIDESAEKERKEFAGELGFIANLNYPIQYLMYPESDVSEFNLTISAPKNMNIFIDNEEKTTIDTIGLHKISLVYKNNVYEINICIGSNSYEWYQVWNITIED